MSARLKEKLCKYIFDAKPRAGNKIPHAHCLLDMNREDEE